MTEWSNELCRQFLHLYESERCIWDPKDKQYKNKTMVNAAWLRISRELRLSVGDLKRKKDSLMATFRGQYRKKLADIKAGVDKVYAPAWFAYEQMESFLAPVSKCAANMDLGGVDLTDTTVIKEEDCSNEAPSSPSSTTATPASTYTYKRHRYDQSEEDTSHWRTEVISGEGEKTDHPWNEEEKRRWEEEDECDLYGKLLAKKLRKLPDDERQMFMYDIDGLFINRLRNINATKSANMDLNRSASSGASSYIVQYPTT